MASYKTFFFVCLVAAVASAPLDPSSSTPPPVDPSNPLVAGAGSAVAISAPVTGVRLTQYANPAWDGQYAGSKKFWMGLADGGCGYGNLLDAGAFPHMMGVSFTSDIRNALGLPSAGVGCGACVRITCPDGVYGCKPGSPSIIANVLDICPDNICTPKQADLYTGAFALLAEGSNPEGVTVERVACPAAGTMRAQFVQKSGTYLKLHFVNVASGGTINSVEVSFDGGASYAPMANEYGAAWVFKGIVRPTMQFRLSTDLDAAVVTLPMEGVKDGIWNEAIGGGWPDERDCGVQFGAGGLGGLGAGLGGAKKYAAGRRLMAVDA